MFFIATIFIWLGMTLAGEALMKLVVILTMLGAIAPMLPGIALGLFLLGPALMMLGIGLMVLGIMSMVPGFSKGLKVLGKAVRMLTSAFSSVPPDVAQGMGQIFMALGNLTELKKSAKVIRSLAYAFFPFTLALMMFPVWKLLLFTYSIDGFQEAVYLLGDALNNLPMDKIQQLMDMLAVMTETPLSQLAFGLWLVSSAIWAMSWALMWMPTKKMVSFELYADSWQKLAEAGVKVTPEVVDNTSALVDQAARYEEVQNDMRWPIFDPFLRALESSAKALTAKSEGGNEIVMVLNEREFARAVEAAMEKKNSVLFG